LTPGSAQAGQVGRQGQGRANGLWLSILKYHCPPATSLLLQLLQIRYSILLQIRSKRNKRCRGSQPSMQAGAPPVCRCSGCCMAPAALCCGSSQLAAEGGGSGGGAEVNRHIHHSIKEIEPETESGVALPCPALSPAPS
jgi:hypothetical protein